MKVTTKREPKRKGRTPQNTETIEFVLNGGIKTPCNIIVLTHKGEKNPACMLLDYSAAGPTAEKRLMRAKELVQPKNRKHTVFKATVLPPGDEEEDALLGPDPAVFCIKDVKNHTEIPVARLNAIKRTLVL